jgi:signal peptidase II
MALVVFVDQLTKLWALSSLSFGMTRPILGSFFQVTLLYNEGGVLGSNFGSSTFYLISSTCVLLFVLYFIYASRNEKLFAWPLAVIAGGALGNIIDRIRIGRVVDFLDFDFFDISIGSFHLERWWKFNIADAAITVGVAFIIVCLLFVPSGQKEAQSPASADSRSGGLDI